MRGPLRDARCVTSRVAWSDPGAFIKATAPWGDHLRARGCAQPLLRRSAVRRAVGGAPPVYRRSHGTASCRESGFVAEIGVNGTSCHITASNPIPGLVPCSWGSPSYEMGKVEHRHLRGHGAVPATRWGKWNMDTEGRRMRWERPEIRAGGNVEGAMAMGGTASVSRT